MTDDEYMEYVFKHMREMIEQDVGLPKIEGFSFTTVPQPPEYMPRQIDTMIDWVEVERLRKVIRGKFDFHAQGSALDPDKVYDL